MMKNGFYLMRTAYKGCVVYAILKCMAWIAYASLGVGEILALQHFFDRVTLATESEEIIKAILILGIVLALENVFLTLTNIINEDTSFIMMRNIGDRLQKNISTMRPELFENTSFLDEIGQASEGIENVCFLINVLTMIFFYHIPYLVFVIWYMASNNIILVSVLIVLFIPIAISQVFRFKKYENTASELAKEQRKIFELRKYISDQKYFKETRILGAFNYFRKQLMVAIDREVNIKLRVSYKATIFALLMQCISFVAYAIALFIMIYAVIKKQYSVSGFYALMTSLTGIIAILDNLFGVYIARVSDQAGNVKYVLKYIEPADEDDKEIENFKTLEKIEIKNLFYRYPGSDEYVIKGINCTFDKKETVAIVGENGSGKSTFIRLLQGMYDEYEGTINYNDTDIQNIAHQSRHRLFTCLFQNFQRYKLSVNENVVLNGNNTNSTVENALKEVDMDFVIDGFERGRDTVLSKEFGGTDLSGGQWQRVAIARAIAKNADAICLDEPTSAIDPLQESSLYKMFSKISKGKMSFIVSHRLGLCAIADRIIVIDKGKIIEDGTHEELMAIKGKYFDMYNKQISLYA